MPFAAGPNLELATIHQEDLVIVVPPSHALARKPVVRLCETVNETYVLYDRAHAPGFHDFVLGILNRAGVIPEVSQIAHSHTKTPTTPGRLKAPGSGKYWKPGSLFYGKTKRGSNDDGDED